MAGKEEKHRETVAGRFERALNMQGFAFQYRVVREAKNLYREGTSKWEYVAPEFPVEVQGLGTRIDVLLRHRDLPLCIVGECMRANPALALWCFAKVHDTAASNLASKVFVESVRIPHPQPLEAGIAELGTSDPVYHIGVETKTDQKGDERGGPRGALEEAAKQVCRGLNGLIVLIDRPGHYRLLGEPASLKFMPVIFTTAELWVTAVDLGETELTTGNLRLLPESVERRQWLFYHYHQGPGLKHSVRPEKMEFEFPKVLYREYVRTIAVVTASGIQEFLGLGLWEG